MKMTQSMTVISGQRKNLSRSCLIISKTAEACVTYLKTFSSKILFLCLKERTPHFKAIKNIKRETKT